MSIGLSSTAERADLFARAHHLSKVGTQVLQLALHGMDTRTIADELVMAHSTTKDHLKALLAKTGSASRHQDPRPRLGRLHTRRRDCEDRQRSLKVLGCGW